MTVGEKESSLVASGVRQRIRPVLVTSTAHACRGGGESQLKAGVRRALTGGRVAGGLVLADGLVLAGEPLPAAGPATLPQAMRVSVEPAASRRRAIPDIMTFRRRLPDGRCAAAVTE